MKAQQSKFDKLLPLWLLFALLLNTGFVMAMSLDRSPADSAHQAKTLQVLVVGHITPTPVVKAAPSPRIQQDAPPVTSSRNRRPRRKLTPRGVCRERRVVPKKQIQYHKATGADDEQHVTASCAAEAPPPAAEPVGVGIPGGGKPGGSSGSKVAGGGSAQVLTALSGGAFQVVQLPAPEGGTGPGLGGSGSALGIGGSGSKPGMPGSGTGLGIGGQGGTTTTPVSSSQAVKGTGSGGDGPGGGVEGKGASQPPVKSSVSKPPQAARPSGPTKRDLSCFAATLQAKIARVRHYPEQARRAGHTGKVKVAFTVRLSGQPANVRVVSPSGHASLDREAVRAVGRAAPFLPLPEGTRAPISVAVNLVFVLD